MSTCIGVELSVLTEADQFTLEDLYKLQPASQAAVQQSAGYAVFNNMGTNLLLLSTARGAGIAVNSRQSRKRS